MQDIGGMPPRLTDRVGGEPHHASPDGSRDAELREEPHAMHVGDPSRIDLLPFRTPHVTPSMLRLKRALDLGLGSALALVSLPLWLIIVAAIRLDSEGPAIFRQERVGAEPVHANGEIRWRTTTFTMYKFRTMVADADDSLHRTTIQAYAAGAAGRGSDAAAPYKVDEDPRITKVGRFLRRTSLDELPQLLNVLQGTMSLVGPRPLPPYEVAEYRPWHRERLCARPGITGLWQIEGRGRTSFDQGTRIDIDYVRRMGMRMDIVILARTLPAVLSRRGAR